MARLPLLLALLAPCIAYGPPRQPAKALRSPRHRSNALRSPRQRRAALPLRASEKPLLSIPIPGSAKARFEIPSFADQRKLLEELRDEVDRVPPGAALQRSAKATRALATLSARVLRDPTNANAPRLARELCEDLGATFVKLGQLVASSPTLFPEEWTSEFENTLDNAPAVPFATVRRTVEASLGTRLSAAFASFDPEPLATASVAQVHAATLRGGERVVVKVLKPGVGDTLTADLAFLGATAKVLEAVAPETKRVALAAVAADLRDATAQELDLTREAARLRSFAGFLERAGLAGLAAVPAPVAELSSQEVLTMTRLDGSRLVDATASAEAEAAVATVIRVWSRSVVEHDFFHADVHGGNVLLLDDGRVGLIDFGIVGTLPPAVYGAVIQLAAAFNAQPRDYAGLATALRDMGVVEEGDVDVDAFAADLKRAFEATAAGDAAAVASDVIAVSENNNLVLPREFGLLTKQAIYLNRYVSTLAPDLDPFAEDVMGAPPVS